MVRRSVMTIACAAACCVAFNPTTVRAQDKPLNFIVILVDDLGWMDLSCQGSTYYRTPNIDRIAELGMRFTNGYAACAVCSPTRAALQTGRYPARIGVTDWIRARFNRGTTASPAANPMKYVGGPRRKLLCPPNPFWMEHGEVTIAEILRGKGYQTAHIGKWHLGDDDWYPQRQGYHVNRGGCDYGQPPSYFDPFNKPRAKHPMLRAGIPHLPSKHKGQFLTHRESDEAVSLIRAWRDQPFFLHIAHYAVHTPIQAIKEVADKYRGPGKKPVHQRYAAMVESVDRSTKRIFGVLEELGLDQQTLVLFTSDNGGLDRQGSPTENAPLRSGKGYAYEGGIRVPFLARWPGVIPAGTISEVPVCLIDILPTFLEAAGLAPEDSIEVDGLSLMTHLRSGGSKPVERRSLYWHFPHYRHDPGPYSIIRRGQWKLIKFYEGPMELFHLGDDLGESRDLGARHPIRVRSMEAELMQALDKMGARLPRRNPDFKSAP